MKTLEMPLCEIIGLETRISYSKNKQFKVLEESK